jgi:hypothetical protein
LELELKQKDGEKGRYLFRGGPTPMVITPFNSLTQIDHGGFSPAKPSFGSRYCLLFKQTVRVRFKHGISVRASSATTSISGEYKNANDVKIALYRALEGFVLYLNN